MDKKMEYKILTAAIVPVLSGVNELIERKINKNNRDREIPACVNKEGKNELLSVITDVTPDCKQKMDFSNDSERVIASELLGQAMQTGLLVESYSGLLKCNIELSELAKSNDGLYRGFKVSNGKIAQQGKFMEVSIPKPLIAFQVLSFITGQYYQHCITQRLDEIKCGVSEILKMMDKSDEAEFKSAYDYFDLLLGWNHYRPEDYNNAVAYNLKLDKLRNKYQGMVNDVKLDVGMSCVSNWEEAKSWVEALQSSRFMTYMKMHYYSELLYYISCVVLINMYSSIGEEQRVKDYMKKLNPDFGSVCADKYHYIKGIVCKNILALREDARMYRDSFKKMYSNLLLDFDSIERLYKGSYNRLVPTVFYEYENGIPKAKYMSKS